MLAQAQQGQIGGQVINAVDGKPLAQATLTLLYAKRKIQTDAQGKFQFQNVQFPDTLLINYIGYKAKVVYLKESNTNLRYELELQNNELQEVVVNTGYQKLKAGQTTGTYSVIDNELLNRQVGTDIFRRLEGITPSLLYDKRGGEGGLNRFTIRGISTLNSSFNSPLIVLDNFPYEGDIANINPNDVENITILRDAAASAVWGTRAGNGVIVITTKSAKFNTPIKFSFSANSTVGEKPNLFANPQNSSAEFLEVEKYLYDRGFYAPIITNTRNRPVLSPYIELLEQRRLGRVNDAEVAQQLRIWQNQDGRNDYDTYFQRTSLNQQYSLNFNGGGKQLSYVGSVGWDNNQSNAIGNSNDRLTIRNQINLKPTTKLNVSAGFIYTQQSSIQNGFAGFNSLRPFGGRSDYYPYVDLVDEQGNALAVERNYRKNYTDTAGGGRLLDWSYRPYDEIRNSDNRRNNKDFMVNVQADYQLFNFLKASVQYRFQNALGQAKNNQNENSYFTRDLINRYTQITGNTVVRPIPLGGIIDEQNTQLNNHSIRGQFDIDQQWGEHRISGIIGGEVRETGNEASSFRVYGFDPLNYTTSNIDLVNRFPIYGNLAGTTNIPAFGGLSSQLDRNVSYYSTFNYSYGRKYDLSFSARKDASNLFGVNANQKGVPLGSVGAAWHIHEENFYGLDWLPNLTLKGSYGITGNVNNSISALTTIRYDQIFLGINSFTGLAQATIVNPPNPDLKWETVKIINTSLDFSSKNNRIS
jgi:TonB-dependent SusC/RagA subfamily outer membrane receptor